MLREELRPRYTWQGIYADFAEAGGGAQAFSQGVWAGDVRRATESALALNRAGSVPAAVCGDDALLPLLCTLLPQSSTRLRVVDFGGGAGISYAALCAAIALPRELEYVVIETSRVAQEGARLFAADSAIRFLPDVPAELGSVDVVFISTALQYIDDWKTTLARLAGLGPRYFLLSRLSAGDVQTYVAAQMNVEGARIPYRFLNFAEVVAVMDRLGYALRFKCASTSEIKQENYPSTHRLGRACNLLFAVKNPA